MCDGSCFREERKQSNGVRGQKVDGQLLLFKDSVIMCLLRVATIHYHTCMWCFYASHKAMCPQKRALGSLELELQAA